MPGLRRSEARRAERAGRHLASLTEAIVALISVIAIATAPGAAAGAPPSCRVTGSAESLGISHGASGLRGRFRLDLLADCNCAIVHYGVAYVAVPAGTKPAARMDGVAVVHRGAGSADGEVALPASTPEGRFEVLQLASKECRRASSREELALVYGRSAKDAPEPEAYFRGQCAALRALAAEERKRIEFMIDAYGLPQPCDSEERL